MDRPPRVPPHGKLRCIRERAALLAVPTSWSLTLCVLITASPAGAAAGAAAAEDDTCPAGGGPGCQDPTAGIPDADLRCVRWRQTGQCNPNGQREPQGDRGCREEIPAGSSGYCECGQGRRARMSTCDHRPFSCKEECKKLRRYTCIGWRQTGGCSSEGVREVNGDKGCDQQIDTGSSGFCECGEGYRVRKPGCEKRLMYEPFTCSEECRRGADLYEELELDLSASEKDIKGSFRRLSLRFHPDKTKGDPAAGQRFSAIREAYDVVSDSERRAIYDAGGFQMLEESKGGKTNKGPAMNGEVHVSLESLYNGEEITSNTRRKVICKGCADMPNSARCRECGAGCAHETQLVNVRMGPMVVQQQQEVPSNQRCRLETVNLPVGIERGMAAGDSVIFKGMGEQRPKQIPGDVKLTIRQREHKVFHRVGSHLNTDFNISLKEALLGFERTIVHLDRRRLTITVHSITKPFGVVRIEGEGMPHRGDPTQHGDLFIKCRVVMPEDHQLTELHRDWLRKNLP